ncbi:hypothetical protein PIB30_028609, partial [Stylosanthes scabra]|nr:hypothetical protein [Stylosanthes scabra]
KDLHVVRLILRSLPGFPRRLRRRTHLHTRANIPLLDILVSCLLIIQTPSHLI